jgi:hypothetical protein
MSNHSFEGNSETGMPDDSNEGHGETAPEPCSCDESLALREALRMIHIELDLGPANPTSSVYRAKMIAFKALAGLPIDR